MATKPSSTRSVASGGRVIQQITAWSYSRYRDWCKCPLLAKLKHVDKLKEPGSPAMERGTRIHKLAEDFVGCILKVLPKEIALFRKEFLDLRKRGATCEQQFAFTVQWIATGWFDKDAWCRVKMDVFFARGDTLFVIDHKTGQVREDDYEEQLSLYALAGFLLFPDIKKVTASLWFLDAGEKIEMTWGRGQLPDLLKDWEDKVRPMLADKRFLPRPGRYCCWCHFRSGNGGPCKY